MLRFAVRLRPEHLFAILALAAMIWVYWPTLEELAGRWSNESQYSHGYLVPIFAGFLLWARRHLLPTGSLRPSAWGLPLLAVGLAVRFAGTYIYFSWLSAISLLLCLAGLCLAIGGLAALRWAWPAIGFLVFMVPMPHRMELALAHPLQRVATTVSTYVLQTVGLPAFAEGNVIRIGDVRIGVVEACSGLSMLQIFFALSAAVTLLSRGCVLERALIFFSAIPIALLSNITRIVVTAILHRTVGSELANYVFHDLAGWLMMPLALAMLWVLLQILSWVLQNPPSLNEPELFLLARTGTGGRTPGSVSRSESSRKTKTTPLPST